MLRRPPRSTRTATLVPYTPLVRSVHARGKVVEDAVVAQPRRIDRQPRSRLVAPMQLLDRQQPRGEESFSVLMIMAEMHAGGPGQVLMAITQHRKLPVEPGRSEEHTSELQSLMLISYAVFCLKKKKIKT